MDGQVYERFISRQDSEGRTAVVWGISDIIVCHKHLGNWHGHFSASVLEGPDLMSRQATRRPISVSHGFGGINQMLIIRRLTSAQLAKTVEPKSSNLPYYS